MARKFNIDKPYHIVSNSSICYPISNMIILKRFLTIFLFLEFCASAMHQVVLDEVSQSGKSVKINFGTLNGLKLDDLGEILESGGTLEAPKYKVIASGKVIKAFPYFSYWYFSKASPTDFSKKKNYTLMLQSQTMLGRNGQNLSYKVEAFESDRAKNSLANSVQKKLPQETIINQNVDKEFVYAEEKKTDDYVVKKEVEVITKKNFLIDEDFEELKYLRADQATFDNKKIQDKNLAKVSTDQNKSQVQSITKSKGGLEELYYKGTRIKYGPGQKTPNPENMSTQYYEKLVNKEMLPAATIAMIKKEGPLWSADMKREELQDYLVQTGIAHEQIRRENAMLFKSGNEVTIFLGSNITNHATTQDISHQNNGFSIGLAYELYLARATQKLMNWSIDMLFEQGTLNVDLGGINGRFTYGALGAHLNYYFFNHPHSRNKIAMYVGAGVKRGNADVTSANFSKDYEYEILALPSLHLGAKYRIPSAKDYEMYSSLGFGFNFKLTVDTNSLSAISSIDDNINSKTSIRNIKADFGLSFFF